VFGETETFLKTESLITRLVKRKEEPWHRWNNGEPISREKLAYLLRQYKIQSAKNKEGTARGYYKAGFQTAWDRYLPPPSKNSSNPSNSSGKNGRK
jgi:hypothetical protein